ncbi:MULTISPECIES: CinA family protein [Henriciella]|jgi:nicotinamide-nucleotide amidase|uniref:Competence damage-inducible protein A n=1 Tax=Henriciella pelagia TaxID=1977912 RepID=A0ABQ1J472_9PROT|nr:CinA family protein [Henriciella pelagia]GGB59458.1 competence damage-inducible protein A [Henriciella pelagia]
MFPDRLRNLCLLVSDEARERRVKIVTAESCTGGMLAALFTEFSGSSDVFERGFVTYSNRSKEEMLGVPGDMIADYGAVSEAVARLMAEGALENSRANLSLSITGIAGPGGGTPMKPVGTVHIACARENKAVMHEVCYFGDIGRAEIRLASIETALEMIRKQIP